MNRRLKQSCEARQREKEAVIAERMSLTVKSITDATPRHTDSRSTEHTGRNGGQRRPSSVKRTSSVTLLIRMAKKRKESNAFVDSKSDRRQSKKTMKSLKTKCRVSISVDSDRKEKKREGKETRLSRTRPTDPIGSIDLEETKCSLESSCWTFESTRRVVLVDHVCCSS